MIKLTVEKKLKWFKTINLSNITNILKRSAERIKEHETLEIVSDISDPNSIDIGECNSNQEIYKERS